MGPPKGFRGEKKHFCRIFEKNLGYLTPASKYFFGLVQVTLPGALILDHLWVKNFDFHVQFSPGRRNRMSLDACRGGTSYTGDSLLIVNGKSRCRAIVRYALRRPRFTRKNFPTWYVKTW